MYPRIDHKLFHTHQNSNRHHPYVDNTSSAWLHYYQTPSDLQRGFSHSEKTPSNLRCIGWRGIKYWTLWIWIADNDLIDDELYLANFLLCQKKKHQINIHVIKSGPIS